MSDKRKKISDRGVALQSGLEVFTSVTVYNGEYVNFGNAFAYGVQLGSQGEHSTTETDFVVDSLVSQPPSIVGAWYRFKTSGSPFTATNAPVSVGGYFVFYGQKSGGNNSYSGIYQKLSGLNIGYEYKITVQSTVISSSGTMSICTYYPHFYSAGDTYDSTSQQYIKSSNAEITFPVSGTSTGITEATFKAKTNNDVLVIYFTTEDTSATAVSISSVSIQERQDYVVPTYVNDKFGVAHKTLRRPDNIITDEVVNET
tara:strand:- start:549 stop:1319 length:771 start_codon:yes stop_codon:yes gene_type:complete